MSSGTCCFHASTASTANSGRVWSHASIASANPCAMKYCADSAAPAISIAASRMEGAVQRTDEGFASGIVPTESTSSAHTGALTERDVGIFLNDGMQGEAVAF